MAKGELPVVFNSIDGGGDDQDSGTESDFMVVDEKSPLLVTCSRSALGELRKQRSGYSSFLNLRRIKRKTRHRKLPWVIVFTAMGMAVMVVLGIVTMFQDPADINNLVDNNGPLIPSSNLPAGQGPAMSSNEVRAPLSSSDPAVLIPRENGSTGLNMSLLRSSTTVNTSSIL